MICCVSFSISHFYYSHCYVWRLTSLLRELSFLKKHHDIVTKDHPIYFPHLKYTYMYMYKWVLYTPLFSRTVIFAVLARCGNSRGVNFAILLMLSLLQIDINWSGNFCEGLTRENKTTAKISARTVICQLKKTSFLQSYTCIFNQDSSQNFWYTTEFDMLCISIINLFYLQCYVWRLTSLYSIIVKRLTF